MKKYSPRLGGFNFTEEQAQEVGEFLEATFPSGEFTPADVVRVAKPKKSPIHKHFEWDNDKAAQKFRLSQARCLIISISVEVQDDKSIKAYHNVVVNDRKVYTSVDNAVESVDIWDQVIERAHKSLLHWKTQYKDFKEFESVYRAIDKVKLKPNRRK